MSSGRVFVDTSGWADPVLHQNDPGHVHMLAYADQLLASHQPIVTTNYVMNELVALMTSRHGMPRADLIRYVDRILAMPWLEVIHIDEATHAEAWALLHHYTDKEWSLVDAASFVVMRRLGIREAFTSDHHFTQAGFIRVPQLP